MFSRLYLAMYLFPYGSEGRDIYQWVGKLIVTFQMCAQKSIILLLTGWLTGHHHHLFPAPREEDGILSFAEPVAPPSSVPQIYGSCFSFIQKYNKQWDSGIYSPTFNFKSQIAFLHLSNPPILLSLFSRGLLNSAIFPQALPVTYLWIPYLPW